MVCLYCGNSTQVVNSRPQHRANSVWRRRKCLSCNAIFSTVELADLSTSLAVIDKRGKTTAFKREKLLISLLLALQDDNKRYDNAYQLCQTVVSKLLQTNKAQLNTGDILQAASTTLKRYNRQAYIRYMAEYDSDSLKSV